MEGLLHNSRVAGVEIKNFCDQESCSSGVEFAKKPLSPQITSRLMPPLISRRMIKPPEYTDQLWLNLCAIEHTASPANPRLSKQDKHLYGFFHFATLAG
ncbi:MAG: hypothetical protein BGO99_08090 [Nitrosospira sp. 56-18]|nr:MAG: hypothetical protein BGO99_08090 [Nitrosospira sp. 56-18]